MFSSFRKKNRKSSEPSETKQPADGDDVETAPVAAVSGGIRTIVSQDDDEDEDNENDIYTTTSSIHPQQRQHCNDNERKPSHHKTSQTESSSSHVSQTDSNTMTTITITDDNDDDEKVSLSSSSSSAADAATTRHKNNTQNDNTRSNNAESLLGPESTHSKTDDMAPSKVPCDFVVSTKSTSLETSNNDTIVPTTSLISPYLQDDDHPGEEDAGQAQLQEKKQQEDVRNHCTAEPPGTVATPDSIHSNKDLDIDSEGPIRDAEKSATASRLTIRTNHDDEDVPHSPDSVRSSSNGGQVVPPKSMKAESIRARLRDQEEKLTELVSHRRRDVTKKKQQPQNSTDDIDAVKRTLQQVEAEKAELEQQLEYLKVCQAEDDAKRLEEQTQFDKNRNGSGKASMKQKQQQKLMENIKFSDEHDAFLRSKLAGIQKGFQEQNAKVQELEDLIQEKDSNINMLQLDISNKLRTIIELEYDIQCHSIHYTEYSQQQYQLGNDAMNELMMIENDNNSDSYSSSTNITPMENNESTPGSPLTLPALPPPRLPEAHNHYDSDKKDARNSLAGNGDDPSTVNTWTSPSNGGSGSPYPYNHQQNHSQHRRNNKVNKSSLQPLRAKKLITKLISDLDALEELYKDEKLKAMETKNQLERNNEELRTLVVVLENEKAQNERNIEQQRTKQKAGKNRSSSNSNDYKAKDTTEYNIEHLRKRVEILEAIRFLYKKEIIRLQDELFAAKKDATDTTNKHSMEVTRLNIALDAMKTRCKTLEDDILGNTSDNNKYNISGSFDDNEDDGVSTLASSIDYPRPTHLQVQAHQQQEQKPSSYIEHNQHHHNNHYGVIEQRIIDCYKEISQLETDCEIKDSQIATLKKEICDLRQKDIITKGGSVGKSDDNNTYNYSSLDSSILSSIDKTTQKYTSIIRSEEQIRKEILAGNIDETECTADMTSSETSCDDPLWRIISTSGQGDANNLTSVDTSMKVYVNNLLKQLNGVREQLAKKDQELAIEKAKSSCMAASLLGKIESLDKFVDMENESEAQLICAADNGTNHLGTHGGNDNNNDDDDRSDTNNSATAAVGSGALSPTTYDDHDDEELPRRKGDKSHRRKEKSRKKVFGRVPLRFYL